MRPRLRLPAVVAVALWTTGCGSPTAPTYTDDALPLAATLLEGLALAIVSVADEADDPRPLELGGGFTIANAEGRARTSTYLLQARSGPLRPVYRAHLIQGYARVFRDLSGTAPPPLPGLAGVLDTDVIVPRAIEVAGNTGTGIPIPESFAPFLSGRAAWPEPAIGSSAEPDVVAWRVDFLDLVPDEETGIPIWYSTARFYFDPFTGEHLGTIVPSAPQVWSVRPRH